MEKLSEIIDYIIKNRSNIIFFCMTTGRYQYSIHNTPGIEITFIYQNQNKKRSEMFEGIRIDLDFDKMFQILRENHIDLIDIDVDDQANNSNDSLHSNDWAFGVFACIDNIEKIEVSCDETVGVYYNNPFPEGGLKYFYIKSRVDLKDVFISHGRYDLALRL